MEEWLKKKPSCELYAYNYECNAYSLEMETAQNETKQTETAPDNSSASASAGEKDDKQNDGSTPAFLDLGSNPNHVGTSSLPIQILKGKRRSFQVTWFRRFKWLHYSPELNAI